MRAIKKIKLIILPEKTDPVEDAIEKFSEFVLTNFTLSQQTYIVQELYSKIYRERKAEFEASEFEISQLSNFSLDSSLLKVR